jgi:hypothetical protein
MIDASMAKKSKVYQIKSIDLSIEDVNYLSFYGISVDRLVKFGSKPLFNSGLRIVNIVNNVCDSRVAIRIDILIKIKIEEV